MSSIVIAGDTSGSVTIAAPAIAGTTVITLPATTGTLISSGGALGTPSSGTLTSCTGLPMTTGVTGTLPIANGGTNSTATAYCSLTTNISGTLPVANGGTGVTTSTGSGANVLGTSPSISGAVMTTMASSVITSGTAVASTSGTSIDFTGIPSWVKRIAVMFNGVSTNGSSNLLIRLGYSGGVETTNYVSQAANQSGGTRSTAGFIQTAEMGAGASLYGQFILNLQSSSTNAWTGNGSMDKNDNVMPWCAGAKTSMTGVLTTVRITTVNGTDTFDAGSINILYE